MHDHHHHHHHDDEPRKSNAEFVEDLQDPASRSLADALSSSFFILRLMMIAVVALYAFSGLQSVEQNELAVVLRFGVLQEKVYNPGMIFVYPRPIDQVIKLPVKERRTQTISTHFVDIKDGQSLADTARSPGSGTSPEQDGALLTGDHGMIHSRWTVTYKIDRLLDYVRNVYLAEEGADQVILERAIENAGVKACAHRSAQDATRREIRLLQDDVKLYAQSMLNDLNTGITIVSVNAEAIPPLQIKRAFEDVSKAENEREEKIEEARQDANATLNRFAGEAQGELVTRFKALSQARLARNREQVATLQAEIDDIILTQAKGDAGKRITLARSFKQQALEKIARDAKEFRSHIEDFKRNPDLLMSRLWNEAQLEIMTNDQVSKQYVPDGQAEVRVRISVDPEEQKAAETGRLKKDDRKPGDFAPDVDINQEETWELLGKQVEL